MFIRTLLFATFLVGTFASSPLLQGLCELNGTPEKVTEIEERINKPQKDSLDLKGKQKEFYDLAENATTPVETLREACQRSDMLKKLRRELRNAYAPCLSQKVRNHLEEGNNADDRLIDFVCTDKSIEVLGTEWEGIFYKVLTTFGECGPKGRRPELYISDLTITTLTHNCEKFDTFTSCVSDGFKDYGNADVIDFVKSLIQHLRATMPC